MILRQHSQPLGYLSDKATFSLNSSDCHYIEGLRTKNLNLIDLIKARCSLRSNSLHISSTSSVNHMQSLLILMR